MSRSDLLPYPLELFPLPSLSSVSLDSAGVPYQLASHDRATQYDPPYIAQYALAHWNSYLTNEDDVHKEAFTVQAHWLLAHQTFLNNDAGGWLIASTHEQSAAELYLSACTQGNGISVLIRAYQLTHEDCFLQAARRVVRTFELDILDGGVHVPLGTTGLLFEEVAVYPALHTLKGHILALFGLHDYVEVTKDSASEVLIQRGMVALHMVLDAYDTGYWTRSDLLHKRLASWSEHAFHGELLAAVAMCFDCKECASVSARWRGYQYRLTPRLQYVLMRSIQRYWDKHVIPLLRQILLLKQYKKITEVGNDS